MGLDDFSTGGTSSSSSSSGASGKQKQKSASGSRNRKSEVDEMKPYFTAVMKDDHDAVVVFKGKRAFSHESRFKNETVLCVIEDEDQFKELDSLSKSYTGKHLKTLFKREPKKAKDFVERHTTDEEGFTNVQCPVCGSGIDMKSDGYTMVFGELVHAGHDVSEVVEELDEE